MTAAPRTMRAFTLVGHGGLDKLVFNSDWPTPVAKAGEVLIKVHACGLNNTDINTRTGWYSKTVEGATAGTGYERVAEDDAAWGGVGVRFPRIQGADVAGEVVEVADEADSGLIGKRVLVDPWIRDWNHPNDRNRCGYFGSECDGGYADYACAPARNVHPVASDLTDSELATFATSSVTAENMLNRADVGDGDVVLITGASGGVGSALIQLARRRGATAIAMASETKHEQVLSIGANAALPRSPENLNDAIRQTIGQDSVSVVADLVGGDGWMALIEALERGGRYVCSGAIAGPIVEFDLRTFYLNDLTFCGATITAPHTFTDLVGYIERGEIRPVLAGAYPFEKLHDAQTAFVAKAHFGNIVVCMDL